MQPYFTYDESIENRLGENPRGVLEVIANRYIGQNPPLAFTFRAQSRNGFREARDGRYELDFERKWPDAKPGQWAYAYGMLWSETGGPAEFVASSFSPTYIYFEGKPIYRSLLAHETNGELTTSVKLDLRRGWNAFAIKCARTRAGFGCVFGGIHPRSIPQPIMSPFAERTGQAGWIFTAPVDRDRYPDGAFPALDASEAGTGLTWYPQMGWGPAHADQRPCARLFGVQPGKIAYGWAGIDVTGAGRQRRTLYLETAGPTEIWIDGDAVWQATVAGAFECEVTLAAGRHSLLVSSVAGAEDWGWKLRGVDLVPPAPIKGSRDAWLYLGPFDAPLSLGPSEIQTLYRLFENQGQGVYWRIDAPETWVRPFVETTNFAKWNYPVGVTLYGLLQTARLLGRPDVIDYVQRHVDECVRLYSYSLYDRDQYGSPAINQHLVALDCLDDCGSFGAATLEAYQECASPRYRSVCDIIGHYIEHEQVRTQDGAFYRVKTMWIDDLYMSTPFLARYSQLTGDRIYIDDAARQFLLFKKYLYMPESRIMSHIYDFKYNRATQIPWGRGNGWCLFSLSEVLERLPLDHPDRPALIAFFNDLCAGYLALQGEDGLWRQVLNDPDAYEETSCTAMFTYAFARGIRFGWLAEPAPYSAAVRKGWLGLTRVSVDALGNVHGVCRGSSYAFTPEYYKQELLWRTNDTHGIGIVMLAGIEVVKLGEWQAQA